MVELEKVKEQIKKFVEECNDKKSLELLDKLATGKMLRSKLILKIAGVNETSIRLCAIVEMIHAASLLHDDVIDEADTRRGKPSVNALYDNKTSIMFGDVLYSKAFTELTNMPQEVAYTISNAVTLLSIGEMLDVDLTKEFNTSYDKYLDMIYKKTASLIEASAKAAAILANKDKDKFALYGKNLGLAFQMIDDILDITQDSQTLGKPALLDFIEGKVTIPYLLLFDRTLQKDKLKSLYKKELSQEESFWIKNEMKATKALEDSINQAKTLGIEAINAVKNENDDSLVQIMKAMIEREF
ncbi:polyprenyl synthetase family protein [Malaciobacter mytili]|uniref:Octaprenyl-diphosphate synthase n=1 Tax=Malaciobacter mytili LMG 24559 TaxID=1032238 RepID=A0AAX2AIW3_9BACT|nr:polyprenyl synthetase family protein [Malaciobacter mytili]AXH14095.1 octaprenyl-diphosphate synthase [Malaciobacter mytili LMG 24559]RXI46711.1 octaprenyl-diphosphate synthase [Malaciobacter mytili]RXK16972.1 octaprenyl-diphosphate synthase [Malaciobacter mytili LMG 24559]